MEKKLLGLYSYFRRILLAMVNRLNFYSELLFWNIHLRPGHRHQWMKEAINSKTRKNQFPQLLLPYIEELRKLRDSQIKILDIGCGPISVLAWGVEQKLFNLVAIDPLAKKYLALLKKHKISYPIKPIKCTGEELSSFFPKKSFDLVYSRNALDHVSDVKKCIKNIYEVLKNNGVFYLEGFIKVGTYKKWRGLHQHDLIPVNGELIHYDKKGNLTNVTADLGFSCIHQEQTGTQVGDWYKIIFKK